MYLQYLGAVFSRALQPTVRITDGLQILAASFVALGARLAGVKMTDDVATNILAYVGMVATAFIVIRLFWAPYSLWKEDKGAIGELKNELSKPERIVTERLAKQRAKAIMRIIEELHKLQSLFFAPPVELTLLRADALCTKIFMLSYKANLPDAFRDGLNALSDEGGIRLKRHPNVEREPQDFDVMELLQAFLHSQITAEYLLSQLPPGIEPETPP